MRIIHEPTLDRFRGRGICELCGKPCWRRVPHHVQTRGVNRLDISCNLISVGDDFTCRCHSQAQRYIIPRVVVLDAIAVREGVHRDDIECTLRFLNKLDKDISAERLEEEACNIAVESVRLLIQKTLKECGKS